MKYSKDLLEKVAKIIIPHLKTKHKKMQAEETGVKFDVLP